MYKGANEQIIDLFFIFFNFDNGLNELPKKNLSNFGMNGIVTVILGEEKVGQINHRNITNFLGNVY